MNKIAIIDDDVYIGDMMERLLMSEGYDTLRAYSGTEALMLLEREQPDLVLLDLMLPGISGEQVLEAVWDIPVIVISAKIDVNDKVNVLLQGASDYLTKPFDNKELLARIKVQLRNKSVFGSAGIGAGKPLVVGALTLDTTLHEVSAGGGTVHLTKTEYAILKLLMQNPNQVITRSIMLDRIGQDTPDCGDSSLNVHMSHLRKKLKSIDAGDCIEAVWGIGFKLNE